MSYVFLLRDKSCKPMKFNFSISQTICAHVRVNRHTFAPVDVDVVVRLTKTPVILLTN